MTGLWQAGLVEVDLPSGLGVRGTLPTLAELIRHGLLPTNLREAALHFADPAWLVSEGEPSEDVQERRRNAVGLVRLLVARFPQQVRNGTGEWADDSTPLADRLAAMGTAEHPGQMDTLDYDLLEDLVLRRRTPEEVTRFSQLLRGEAEPAETDDERFREERGGTEAGAGGEPLARPVAGTRVPRRRGSGAGVPARRGAGTARADRGAAADGEAVPSRTERAGE